MNKSGLQSRVNYFEKQYLRRQDFVDEQSYQVVSRRRHNIASHSWGIVIGLELVIEEGALVVRPGMAIDGYGRELFLPMKRPIDSSEFTRLGSDRLDVWLRYEKSNSMRASAGYVACGEDDSADYYRTSEGPIVILERAAFSRINARRPKAVPSALIDSNPQLQSSDDPLTVWPIYLGRVTYVPREKDPAKQYLVDASDRSYAGITAEAIDHPANPSRIELDKTSPLDDQRTIGNQTYFYRYATGSRGFAVFVPPPDPDEVDLAPRFQIDTDGTNYLRGKGTVYGHLQMAEGGAVQFTKPAQIDDTVPRIQPSIYYAGEKGFDELRVDLGTGEGRTFVVGFTKEDGSFQPSMKLEYVIPTGGNEPQPRLTIYGDLKIEGLLQSPEVLDRTLTSETLNALLASFQAGSIAAGGS